MDIIGFHYYFNELLVNWRYIQFHFTKNMDSTQQSSDIQKKLTWSPPISHFIHFLGYHLQDQPLFQEKKLTGVPLDKAFLI